MVSYQLWVGMAAAACGVSVLRWSWSLKRRSGLANLAGWGVLLLACVLGGSASGAWGVSVVALAGMAFALSILAWAAATSPAGRSSASERRVRMLPDGPGPLHLGRRFVTFALVVVGGFAASVGLAIALRVGTLGLGWSQSDANAVALCAVPLVWGILATVLLMLETRRQQLVALLATSLPLIPALVAGG